MTVNTAYQRGEAAARMGEATVQLLAALAPDQRRRTVFDFNSPERKRWNYTSAPHTGLRLSDMEPGQRRLVHQLVACGLSVRGYAMAMTIMGLERTLDAVEGWRRPGPGRDPDFYHVSVFGTPSMTDPWAWRFEGHHLSINYTIVAGHVVAPTPTFFGANPAEVSLGGRWTLRPLAATEDLGRDLVQTLTTEQGTVGVISEVAPPDIVTRNRPSLLDGCVVEGNGFSGFGWVSPVGLNGSQLTAAQQEILWALVGEYIKRLPDELAEGELANLQDDGVTSLYFAWAGGAERGDGHYYRIQGPRFLVEYDNTQNDANHIHSVWRDPYDDFGAQLLARHYADAHHGG